MKEGYPVQSVKRAFDIMETLVDIEEAGVSELSEQLGMPKSTIHDYLTTLTNIGFVIKDGSSYSASLRFLKLGEDLRQNMTLVEVATPELQELAQTTEEHVTLVTEEDGNAVIIGTERGDKAVNLQVYNGIRLTMHSTAPGKAIMAHFSKERVDKILDIYGMKSYTEQTITDRESLDMELEEIRQQGYAFDDEERISGMRSVAAPIIDRSDTVHGAITISGPTQRIDDVKFTETLPQLLLEKSNVIEVALSYD